ncbi:MAG: penicillin-binding protein 1A [Reyranellaceae bacterium]
MRVLKYLGVLVIIGIVVAGAGGAYLYAQYSADLPDHQQLEAYEPPVTTRLYAADGRLLAEYAKEKRIYVPITATPKRVINAFVASEDQRFFTHPGVDALGVIRAALSNLSNMGQNKRPEGASSITQQVAKNFLLSNEATLARKIREAILALRIENTFSKQRILELYLNEIFLGSGNYGVAAASLNYFGKSLDELTIGEAAYLAALPKAPSNYSIQRAPAEAKARRDYVVGRMLEDGYITAEEAAAARAEPLQIRRRPESETVTADFFAEEVRRQIYAQYGETTLYEGGLAVRTTLDSAMQPVVERALRDGLVAYDRKHGWRGPFSKLPSLENWKAELAKILDARPPIGKSEWTMAVVLKVEGDGATIGLPDGKEGSIPFQEMAWARPTAEEQRVGPAPRKPSDVVTAGDVVVVERATKDAKKNDYPAQTFALRQIPDVDGGAVVLDPHTGRVLAMAGGWSFQRSQYNRVTQALRQPGSSFKPFVYLTALEEGGLTPASLVLDAPFVYDPGPNQPLWKPENYSRDFLGPTTLRRGIEKSRNLMTVRIAQYVGMDKIAATAKTFGVVDDMIEVLPMALGAGETTLVRMATAYGMLVNGGKRITPTLIDRVQDRRGATIYRHDGRSCDNCLVETWNGQAAPVVPDDREQIYNPQSVYQMVHILQGVTVRGTAASLASLNKPLAGKTGTSNDAKDLWFMGFSPDLVIGVYVGFDEPRTLGRGETGGSVAVPIFRNIAETVLKDRPNTPFRIPPDIQMVRINAATGEPAGPGDRNVILEAFKPGTEPTGDRVVLDGTGNFSVLGVDPAAAAGGNRPTLSGTGETY